MKKYLLSPVLIVLLWLLILLLNYSPSTWLSGWDNLHSEFNFFLNIKRSLFSVWQEYQGLGLLGGMGHAADLPRQIFLWIVSFVLPDSFSRYFFHFVMLLIGPLGVYYLLKNIVFEHYHTDQKRLGSLIGGLFYLFNLVTLQMFYLPYEPYSVHYGFLPWLFWSYLNFLKDSNRKNLFLILVINLLAVSQGYVITFFFVYMVSLTLLSFYFLIKKQMFKKIFLAYFLIFLVNSFWLLPNLYFVYKKVGVNVSAKINQMSTDDNLLRNKKFGNLSNTMLLKSFWFDNVEMDKEGIMRYQMEDWRKYLDNPFVLAIGYTLFALVVIGIIYSIKNKKKEIIIFLPVLLFSFTILSNDTPLFSFIASIFYKIPFFTQIFRFPFTKFSILTALGFSIFFSYGCLTLINSEKNNYLRRIIFTVFISLPLIFLAPVFTGKFFYQKERAVIPQEYFQIFDFFKKQDTGRIANFPQYTFWGWTLYRWNYSGSGFMWYGIEQPILDRAFDVWGKEDENYYHEISYALYSRNQKLFEDILEKYQIRWLLVDGNIISFASGKTLYFDHLEQLIASSNKFILAGQLGKISIYKVNLDSNPKNFIFLTKDLSVIGQKYGWNNYDKAYEEYGNYITETQNSNVKTQNQNLKLKSIQSVDIYYPFRSLFTGRQQNELEFGVEDLGDYFSFKSIIPKSLTGYKLILPRLQNEEVAELNANDLSQSVQKIPQLYLDGEYMPFATSSATTVNLPYIKEGNLEVRIPKINGYYSYNYQPLITNQNPKSCDQFNKGTFRHDRITDNNSELLRLTSLNSSNCLDFDLPNLSQNIGYLVRIENRNIEGKSLLFSIINDNSQRADLETYLPKKQITDNKQLITKSFFLQPPMEEFGIGYTLHLDNISIGRAKTINDLGRITVNPIPYRFLTGLKIEKDNFNPKPKTQNLPLLSVDHPNASLYQVSINPSTSLSAGNTTLVLSQSYDEGWGAYQISNPKSQIQNLFPFIFGKKLKDHVLVNNWENGWNLDNLTMKQFNNGSIIIVYLPQYLEYFGFVLFGVAILIVLFYADSKNTTNYQTPNIN